MDSFVHLHLHSEYSLLDGLTRIKPLMAKLKEFGQNACAITDHGNLYGAIEFFKACKKNDIKPIIGCEVYVAPISRFDKTAISRRNFHLILLVKDRVGYKNLIKLVSLSHLEGFYYKPRIDWELLETYHQGLICLSGCAEGEIAQLIFDDDYNLAKDKASLYRQLFGPDYYLEIQKHPGLDRQDQANQGLIKISRQLGIPLVATNDSHYLTQDEAFAQDVILMINTQTTLNDKKRLTMIDIPDFYVKSTSQMTSQFLEFPDAIDNTQKIADKCQLEIETGKWYFPKFTIPPKTTAEQYLNDEVSRGAKNHYGRLTKEIQDRLDYELEIINSKGYAPYFLIMRDFIEWCQNNDTPTNTRGSTAGSLVAFVLGISSVDPLVYQLPFERFLNKDRPSPPDIDLDVADTKRQLMLHHIINQYGKEAVAQVCTFGRMLARASVRDTARVLGYDYSLGDRISKLIPEGSQGFPMTIKRALDESPDLFALYQSDTDAKKILDTAKQVEGNARHISVHACGIVISPTTINDFCPSQLEPGGDKIITQYELHAVEDIGLIKFDILGIDNLSFLGQAVVNVRKTKNIEINLRKIPLDDRKTFEMLSRGHTMGVFQLSGEGMTKWLKELKPNRVEDLMAMVALYRPGPIAMIPEYIARKKNPQKITYFDPRMEKWLGKSYGLLVYQDDCLYTAIELAGYNWVEVDKFRRAIGKKIPEEMADQKEKFIKGCTENGLSQAKAEEIFGYIQPFTSYGFNKAHAASYGMLAYRTAYMKANFPVEYMCALLSGKADDVDTISAGVSECRSLGIIVNPPDINDSVEGFETEPNRPSLQGLSIRFGLGAIKNVGEAAITNILSEKRLNGQFQSFNDFCLRVDSQKVNKKVLESLIMVGALDRFGERNSLLASIDKIRADCDRLSNQYKSGQFGLFESKTKQNRPSPPLDKLIPTTPMTESQKLDFEKQLLGVFVSENPLAKILAPFQNFTFQKISDFLHKPPQTPVKFVAVTAKIKIIRTKRDNAKMAFVTLKDETNQIEAVVFPKIFEINQNLLLENKALYLEGHLTSRDNTTSVILDIIATNPPDNSPKYDFILEIPPHTSQSKLMELNRLLKQSPNGHRGLIIFPDGKRLPLSFGIAYTPTLQEQINRILYPS